MTTQGTESKGKPGAQVGVWMSVGVGVGVAIGAATGNYGDRRRHVSRDDRAPAEPKAPGMKWSVYIVRCRDGALYTGIAIDVLRRLEQHARPGGRGAKSLRGRGPLSLAARRIVGSRSLAQSVESRIKALSRPRKLWLIAKPSRLDRFVASAARASRSAAGIADRTKPISQSQLGRSKKRAVPRLNHDMR